MILENVDKSVDELIVFFSYLESSKCENDMHMLNDRIGAVMSHAVSCCLTLLFCMMQLESKRPTFHPCSPLSLQ